MNKFVKYVEAKTELEQLTKKLEALESDETLRKTLEFKEALESLMDEYEATQEDVLSLLGLDDVKAKSANDKRRGKRPLKTYTNPHTGETIKTRGGNHRTLNAWRDEYSKEEVDSWLQ